MVLVKWVFFSGLFILFYTHFGYGIFLWLWTSIRKTFSKPHALPPGSFIYPPVTLIVAAYNEEDFIDQKIQNSLSLDYDADKLHFIFITDGSTDSTPNKVRAEPRIQLLHNPQRQGKAAALHKAMQQVITPFVVYSDTNTLLNKESIKNIVKHYSDNSIGGVSGEKKILPSTNDTMAGTGEGLYWRYESFLKKLEWEFYTVVGAAGELFSIRTDLYEHPGDDVVLDDFAISMNICKKGYRVAYEPKAYAIEAPSASIKEEMKRKVRISAGAFQAIHIFRSLLNFFKTPYLSFQYISHRILRWTLCPLLLPVVLVCNILLLLHNGSPFYVVLFALQLLFYIFGFAGWLLFSRKIKINFLYAIFYFLFINIALYKGFFRFLKGSQSVLWEKVKREKMQLH